MPVHRPPAMLPLAIESVLAQTVTDFDLVVICDGAPPETAACAQEYADRDPRVRVLDLPKGERHGEAHRHRVLEEVDEFERPLVAQVADDDLWFPGHLTELQQLLAEADFGNLLQVRLLTDGGLAVHLGDLADPHTRERMRTERFNFFGPSVAGYRLAAYRSLVHGWQPAPTDVWSDLHMWRAFLDTPGLRLATRHAVEGVSLPAAERSDVDLARRAAENRRISAELLGADLAQRDFRARAFAELGTALIATTAYAQDVATAHQGAIAEIADLWTHLEGTRGAFEAASAALERKRKAIRRLRARNQSLAEELAALRVSAAGRRLRWPSR
nr:glycosyltransferase family 2 protein [Nocardioides kongjuensis]